MPQGSFRLSGRARRALRALAPIICPPDAGEPGLVEAILDHVALTLGAFPAGPRGVILGGLYLFDLAAALRPPYGRPFSRLPPGAARRYFHGWWTSRHGGARRVAVGLKGLLALGYYEQPAVLRALEYDPAAWIAATALRRRALWAAEIAAQERLTRAPDPLRAPVRPAPSRRAPAAPRSGRDLSERALSCDVVVVGSGAGGAVVAAELAEAGLDVIVLEEGGYHPSDTFTAEATAMIRRLYRAGGAQTTIGAPAISFSEGRCVGGSTTVNGGMCWRTPATVLRRWAAEHDVAGILPEQMAPYFRRVERFVAASGQDPESIGADQRLLRAGAERLGWAVLPNIRNQVHCGGCNNCILGCPTDAKRSTLVSYIPRALGFGARLYADCRVEQVIMQGKRATGVRGRVTADDGRAGAPFTVRARRVVLAAGAIQTPAILLRSAVRAPCGQIGRNLTLHPNAAVAAMFDAPVDGWQGVHQAYQVRQFQDEGLIMAAVNLPPGLLAMAVRRYGAGLGAVMRQYNHIVTAGVLVEDTGAGRVRLLPNKEPAAFYNLADRDAQTLVRGTALLAEALFAAGARRVLTPFEGVADLRSAGDARALGARRIPAAAMDLSTVHVMGTARMGGDPTRHVCDSYGRVYNTEGLTIADASLFPTPIGINPMETIMALATRNAARILETWDA
jgi:choline dehydrogenase-like flavoprotein